MNTTYHCFLICRFSVGIFHIPTKISHYIFLSLIIILWRLKSTIKLFSECKVTYATLSIGKLVRYIFIDRTFLVVLGTKLGGAGCI
jgi:hypothetical protein